MEFVITHEKIKFSEENIYYERLFVDADGCIKISEELELVKCNSFFRNFKSEIKKDVLKESIGIVIADGLATMITSGIGILLIVVGLVSVLGIYSAIKILLLSTLVISVITFAVNIIIGNLFEKFSRHGNAFRLNKFKRYLTNEYVNCYYNKRQKTGDGSKPLK